MKLTLPKFLLAMPLCLSLSGTSAPAQNENAAIGQRAQALGALAHLPKSTEGAVSIRNLSGIYDAVVDSNVFARVMELSGQAGDGANDMIKQIRQGLSTYAGDEVTFAYAAGTAVEVKRLMSLYDIYVRATYGAIGKSLSGGEFNGGMDPEAMLAEAKTVAKDPNSAFSKAFNDVQVPPMIIGSKMGNASADVIAQIEALEGQLPPFVTVANFDVQGSEFKSWAVNLKDVFDENGQAQLEEFIGDKAASDRIATAIRGKRIEVSYGVLGDYFVVGIGRNHSHLEFVENPADSLVSLPHFDKLDPFLGKPIHGVAYMNKALLQAEDSNLLFKAMAESFVGGATSGGSDLMKKLGAKLMKLGDLIMLANKRHATDYVGIMYGGNGLSGQGFGGWMMDSLAGKQKLAFANASIDDAFMVIDNAVKEKYNAIGIEMMETMASAVPLGAKLYGEISGDQGGVDQYMQMQQMFAPKIEKIWGIVKGKFFAGLGNDSAVIVDLNGTLPKIPGVPRVIVNQGKAPRIAMANTVKNRKLLTEAWEELVPAVNDLLASIPGQEKGAEVQMPDALSSEKGGLATHYFGLPFLSNDFMPSLSVSDKLFFMSTSKKFSESIAAKAGTPNGDLRGIYFNLNFNQLNKFAASWLSLISENKDTVFAGNEFAAEDFEEGAAIARQVLKLTRALKGMDYNKYTTDANETRSTWHLRLKDVK